MRRTDRPKLPRPEVSVDHRKDAGAHHTEVVISRDGKAKSYLGSSPDSANASTAEAIKRILDDGHTAEWLP